MDKGPPLHIETRHQRVPSGRRRHQKAIGDDTDYADLALPSQYLPAPLRLAHSPAKSQLEHKHQAQANRQARQSAQTPPALSHY